MSPLILQTVVVLAMCSMPAAAESSVRGAPLPAPRVYVYTAQTRSGVVTEEEQGRLDSVRDVREALRGNARIVLVPDAAAAQVVVEVVSREKRDAPAGGFGGTVITPLVETTVRLHVAFGSHETEIKGVGQAYWGRAAKDAAARLIKWIVRMSATP